MGEKPDCHATSMAGKFVYIACRDGLYCITRTDQIVNTLCAHEGLAALGLTGYIQGISAAQDDSTVECGGTGRLGRPRHRFEWQSRMPTARREERRAPLRWRHHVANGVATYSLRTTGLHWEHSL